MFGHLQTVLSAGWPVVMAIAALAVGAWTWLSDGGYIDRVVHESQLDRLRMQVEVVKDDVGEIKRGVDRIGEIQRRQGESLARIEARR